MTVEFLVRDPASPSAVTEPAYSGRPLLSKALWRGFRRRCPRCNGASLFSGFLKVRNNCPACGLALHHHRADDLPPYLTIMIVGHVVVGAMLAGWKVWHLSDSVQYALWPTLALALSLSLLAPIKGAVVGLQWALGMHGFAQSDD
jgi:uncharacterized protein (DUF983 family)